MFTGIIERLAEVKRVAAGDVCRLDVDLGPLAAEVRARMERVLAAL